MYLRITQRHNRDGSTVSYYALAESVWNPDAKRREANVVHSFGRADQLDRGELERLVKSINRVLEDGNDDADSSPTSSNRPEIEIERVFELGVVLAARSLWEELGVGPAIRRCAEQAKLTAPHETALFAMTANRLEDPVSKLACAERWLPDIAWLPDAAGLAVDQCYRALDFLAVWAEEIEREVFLKAADLFRLDVDLILYDAPRLTSRSTSRTRTSRNGAGGYSMRVLGLIIRISALPVLNAGKQLTLSDTVAAQLVGHDDPRLIMQTRQQPFEEASRGLGIAPGLDEDVEHNAVLVDGTPKIALHALDTDEDLVHSPFSAWPWPATSQTLGKARGEFLAAASHRLVGDDDTAFCQDQLDIALAEAEHVVQPYGVTDDLGGEPLAVMGVGWRLHASVSSPPGTLEAPVTSVDEARHPERENRRGCGAFRVCISRG